MELIKQYWTYLLTLISLIISIVSFILKSKTNTSTKKVFNILTFLPQFINEAENIFQLVAKSGHEKLLYVLNQIRCLCSEVGLNFDKDFWQKKIEEYLSTPNKKI